MRAAAAGRFVSHGCDAEQQDDVGTGVGKPAKSGEKALIDLRLQLCSHAVYQSLALSLSLSVSRVDATVCGV